MARDAEAHAQTAAAGNLTTHIAAKRAPAISFPIFFETDGTALNRSTHHSLHRISLMSFVWKFENGSTVNLPYRNSDGPVPASQRLAVPCSALSDGSPCGFVRAWLHERSSGEFSWPSSST